MKELKNLLRTDIGRVVGVNPGKEGGEGAQTMRLYRVKSYDNAHKRAWLVANTEDWRNNAESIQVGFKSITFVKQ